MTGLMRTARSLLLLCAISAVACDHASVPPPAEHEQDGGFFQDAGMEPDAGGESPGEPPELAGILQAHNEAREAEGVDLLPLSWDPELASIARAWAAACQDTKAPAGLLDHNGGRSDGYPGYVGENIYGASASPRPARAVESWMEERADYDYDTNTCSGICGHYTQVVWRGTTRVGCALADCSGLTFRYAVVCNYAPGGNLAGARPY